MISINGLEYIKRMAELQLDMIPGGVLFVYFEGDTIVWRKASTDFDIDLFQIGDKMVEGSIAGEALRTNETITRNIPRALYGIRMRTIAEPVVNDEGNAIGVFSIALPRLHPIARAFPDFAPIMADMFPEGSVLYVSDLNKIFHRQASKKFDVPQLALNLELSQEDTPYKVLQSKTVFTEERDASVFGVPVLECCYPLFDEDNPEAVVATLGVIIPKILAGDLRQMSENLNSGVGGIASAIEELAATATSIHSNEQELNEEIQKIIQLSEEINEVTAFIKEIADETKMLGLNAAIEAARAGEAGKGFGVVAEEIRKLSEQSKSTVPKIKELTERIMKTVEETSKMSHTSLDASQEQAAASEEISASVEQITNMSSELNQISQKL